MYDGLDLVLVYDDAGSLENRYLYGPAVDQLFADEDALGEILWPLGDHQGTIRDVVRYDSATDTTSVVNHLKYDSFGNITSQTSSADQPLFAFTGRYWDEDVQLQWNWMRWYEPASGMWLSPDPIGFASGDTNPYRYAGNSPVNLTDPTGLIASPTPDTMMNPDNYRNWYYAYTQEIQAGAVMPAGPGGGGQGLLADLWTMATNPLGTVAGYQYSRMQSASSMRLAFQAMWEQMTGDPNYVETYSRAYEYGPLGQTASSSGLFYYGTRVSLGIATASAGAAGGIISWQFGNGLALYMSRINGLTPTWHAAWRAMQRNISYRQHVQAITNARSAVMRIQPGGGPVMIGGRPRRTAANRIQRAQRS